MSLEKGSIVKGTVVGITAFGAFIELPDGNTGLVHISEISNEYVKKVKDFLARDDQVEVKVIGKNKKGKYDLSIKQAKIQGEKKENKEKFYKAPKPFYKPKEQRPSYNASRGQEVKGPTFENKLARFLKDSEEKQLAIKKNTESKRRKRGFNR